MQSETTPIRPAASAVPHGHPREPLPETWWKKLPGVPRTTFLGQLGGISGLLSLLFRRGRQDNGFESTRVLQRGDFLSSKSTVY